MCVMKLKFALYCDNDVLIKELQQVKDSAEDIGPVVFLLLLLWKRNVCLTLEHLTWETHFQMLGKRLAWLEYRFA